MDREKAYEREQFTYEEKRSICLKSEDRCCHCGKLKYIGYGATMDHFIPLHKGGSNRAINLIMLCEDCNKEKDDKIVDMSYIPYLKDKYKNDLRQYLQSYISVIDYIERNRLFACDEYSIVLKTDVTEKALKYKRNINNPMFNKGLKYKLKLARWDDYTAICDYFEKYLKKYNRFDSRRIVEKNITFWMQFGCIYYIERQGEIALMTVFTVRHVEGREMYEEIEYVPNMYLFPYYASETVVSLAVGAVTNVARFILEEQHIKFLPYIITTMDADKSAAKISYHLRGMFGRDMQIRPGHIPGFSQMQLILDMCESNDEFKQAVKSSEMAKVKKFTQKFGDVEDKIQEFFDKIGDMEDIGWMIRDLLGYTYIKESHLTQLAYQKSDEEVEKAIQEELEHEEKKLSAKNTANDIRAKRMYAKMMQAN